MNKKIGNLFKGDKVIWMVFLFLCLISIVEVFSASSTLTYKSQNYMGPIIKHTGMIVFGVFVAILTLNIPCRYFKLITPFLLLTTGIMLVWVLFFGAKTNDAGRWINLAGLTFQPSELAKGTLVLATAQILSAMQREDGSGADPKAMKYILTISGVAAVLIGLENLSTAGLICGVIIMMMFIGRIPKLQMGKLLGVLVALVAVLVISIMTFGAMDNDSTDGEGAETTTEMVAQAPQAKKSSGGLLHRLGTWRNRIIEHLNNKDVKPEDYDLDKNMQVAHANIAIVSSNFIGKGPGNSTERDFLPQAFSDFIFAIVIEEMGIIGAIVVVFLYIILLFRCAIIASRCENNFPAFLVMGLGLLLVSQAVLNMLVAVGIFPVTGQPLPLISKGGTSTIINCAYIGAILSVSRSAKLVTKK
jgi:cell division protein FtsW